MGAETVVTLIAVAIAVAAIALYLIIIAGTLTRVSRNLDIILRDVIYAVEQKTSGMGGVVGAIANDVNAIDEAMTALTARRGGGSRRRARAY